MALLRRRPDRRTGKGIAVRRTALGPRDDQFDALAGWLREVATPAASLLDIGSGDGDDAYSASIRPLVDRFVGVDPDDRSCYNRAVDRWYPMTIEAFADLVTNAGTAEPGQEPPPLFDLALAIYVAEHVSEPVAFLSAAHACLKPGGSLFLITPNKWHYFGIAATVAMRLRIDDWLLEALRRSQHGSGRHGVEHRHHGHGPVEPDAGAGTAAHFPMAYKMNSVRALRRSAGRAGFTALEVRHLENPAVFETYFPERLAAVPRAYSRAAHRLGLRGAFGTLICRLVS